MSDIEQFNNDKKKNINEMSLNNKVSDLSIEWIRETAKHNYTYNFSWLGLPIIQFPQDIVAMQEIIWSLRPDLIIETGVARGGSVVFYASMLELIHGPNKDPKVIGIDIDIRKHNREAIEQHQFSDRIVLIEGSSISEETVQRVKEESQGKKTVLVCLDSNHTHAHVLKELEMYNDMVTVGSYCVVFDTVVEDMPSEHYSNRPWKKGDNPKTAVHEFLKSNSNFVIDKELESKLLITVCPDGYLKRKN